MMITTMRADLARDGYSIPQINGDQMFTAEAVKEMTYIYQCDVTGQTAMNNKGELIVFYGIDLDFDWSDEAGE